MRLVLGIEVMIVRVEVKGLCIYRKVKRGLLEIGVIYILLLF